NGIPYATVSKEYNYCLSIVFRDSAARDQSIYYLSPSHRDLFISSQGDNSKKAVMNDERLKEARQYSYQQNINILSKRLNQL
ncbi:protein translocase subunit SecD, partial [Klebsiella pneumoniae]